MLAIQKINQISLRRQTSIVSDRQDSLNIYIKTRLIRAAEYLQKYAAGSHSAVDFPTLEILHSEYFVFQYCGTINSPKNLLINTRPIKTFQILTVRHFISPAISSRRLTALIPYLYQLHLTEICSELAKMRSKRFLRLVFFKPSICRQRAL